MIVDLHAHFPMHVRPRSEPVRFASHPSAAGVAAASGDLFADLQHAGQLAEWLVLQAICGALDYNHGHPCVDVRKLIAGEVGIALSPLYWPPDELVPGHIQRPPQPGCFDRLVEQLDAVEAELAPSTVRVARSFDDLSGCWAAGQPAIVHAVEGGFALGTTPTEVRVNMVALASRGVAYVTLAHLFWLHVACNVPAIPFLKDDLYQKLFPQPDEGLTDLGRAAVAAAAENGVLVDVTHMTPRAIEQTFAILDECGGKDQIPVIASHGACRMANGGPAYNLHRAAVERIAARGGVIGLLLCDHYMSPGVETKKAGIERSLDIFCAHADTIARWTGGHDAVAIGTDLDGFINPTLPGLEDASKLGELEKGLKRRYPEGDTAEKICFGNALAVLEKGWRR